MNGRKQPESDRPLPRKLRRLTDPEERFLSDQVASELTASDVAALRDVVARRTGRPADVDLSRAISALAVRDPSPETASALARFAADEREAPIDRAVAAGSLRLIPNREARQGLIPSLRSPEPIVRLEAIKSLGTIGDEESLAALDAVARPANAGEGRQLAFARALISHRLGRSSDDLPFQRGVARRTGPKDELISLSLRPVRSRTIAAQRERLSGPEFGIPLSEGVGFELRAGRARWSVFVNGEITEGGGVFARSSRIFERPWITALLARHDERTKSAAVQYVVLSDPDEGGAKIMVVRTDGEPVYSGELKQPKGLLSFVVHDIARRGTAPTNVRGHLTTSGVEFEVNIPFGRRRDPSAGATVVAPR